MPNVLITGGSDGIGRALVTGYDATGWTVWTTGRRPRQDVEPALPERVAYVEADLTQQLDPVVATLPDQLDLAIMNAGMGKVAAPAAHTAADISDMISLNVTAPLLLAQALLPRLEATQGTLAFIGSTAAKGAHKDFSVYAATKAALNGAIRSLKLEWDGRVTVLMIHPGPTATSMHDKAGLGNIAARRLFTAPNTVAGDIATAIAGKRDRRFGPGYMLRQAVLGART